MTAHDRDLLALRVDGPVRVDRDRALAGPGSGPRRPSGSCRPGRPGGRRRRARTGRPGCRTSCRPADCISKKPAPTIARSSSLPVSRTSPSEKSVVTGSFSAPVPTVPISVLSGRVGYGTLNSAADVAHLAELAAGAHRRDVALEAGRVDVGQVVVDRLLTGEAREHARRGGVESTHHRLSPLRAKAAPAPSASRATASTWKPGPPVRGRPIGSWVETIVAPGGTVAGGVAPRGLGGRGRLHAARLAPRPVAGQDDPASPRSGPGPAPARP